MPTKFTPVWYFCNVKKTPLPSPDSNSRQNAANSRNSCRIVFLRNFAA